MDILSLGKANKTLRRIQQLDQEVIAPNAESHFRTVDERLDWIEGQANKILVENSQQIDLSKGTFVNTELVNEKIQLKQLGEIIVSDGESNLATNPSNAIENNHWGNRYGSNVFDGPYNTRNADSGWTGNGIPSWVGYDFKTPTVIQKFVVSCAYLNGAPKQFVIEGSNDKNSWKPLYTSSDDVVWSAAGETKVFILNNSNSYQYYRIYVTAVQNVNYNYVAIGQIQMIPVDTIKTYITFGTYESPVIDLGEGWKETKIIDIVNQIKTDSTNCILEVSTSTDGVSFTPYTLLDTANSPQSRYIKIRATLSAQEQQGEAKNLDFNQSNPENIMNLNEFTEANGNLQLKNHYTQDMTDDGVLGAGKVFSTVIQKNNFKKITKIGVN